MFLYKTNSFWSITNTFSIHVFSNSSQSVSKTLPVYWSRTDFLLFYFTSLLLFCFPALSIAYISDTGATTEIPHSSSFYAEYITLNKSRDRSTFICDRLNIFLGRCIGSFFYNWEKNPFLYPVVLYYFPFLLLFNFNFIKSFNIM